MMSNSSTWRRPRLSLPALAAAWLLMLAGWLLSTVPQAGVSSPASQSGLVMPVSKRSSWVGSAKTLGQGIVRSAAGTLNPTNKRASRVTGEP